MRLLRTISGLRSYLENFGQGQRIGLVPTMGALHAGHLSLIERAKKDCSIVIVSIFVNPLQFRPSEDLNSYPQSLEQDCDLGDRFGVDVIFAPTTQQMYGHSSVAASTNNLNMTTQVVPPVEMTSVLCGSSREGHFQGVATVVTKLFNLVNPAIAYFGQKDAQQLAIIRRIVADLNLPVEIVAVPIVREESGLAYSSRNQYLTAEQKAKAATLYTSLQLAKKAFQAGEKRSSVLISIVKDKLASVEDLQPEYIELVDPKTLKPLDSVQQSGLLAIACAIGSTRLIDNLILRQRQPIIAIDGPAGAGKSTVARQVADTLGLLYLDTGAMYRAITWLVMKSGIEIEDETAIAELIGRGLNISFDEIAPSDRENQQGRSLKLLTPDTPGQPIRVFLDREEITKVIRTPEVTANVSAVSQVKAVRTELVKQQQTFGERGGLVAEGRDIGTHVFPDAELKIFLTASVQERATRRWQDLSKMGRTDLTVEMLAAEIAKRDRLDSTRTYAPLRQAEDAIEVQTDNLSIEQVIQKIVTLYQQQLGDKIVSV
ncbi:MAG: bifunctional pantoate--beta-alanine ligase/(d)CMP kinase [Oscillatoria sp. PMC 1068.18]|nr:bifunctional pantoate--beta-alanine ligase/(d)CMP kinase [Oscillatoria sp. PMC 1076.18]MEC4988361.1 bifunctional pantoate--beta-alanine ligase/(d)CMP kinase [Oscillatoria sp. PMC 1068.18]